MSAVWQTHRLVPNFPTTRAKLSGIASQFTPPYFKIFLVKLSARNTQIQSIYWAKIIFILKIKHQEWLLREPKLKLTRAIEICQTDELSLQQLKLLNQDKEVEAINKTRQPRRKYIPKNNPEARKPRQDRDECKTWKTCTNCGNKHPKQKCPAFGRQCNKCKKFNHYAKMCRSSGKFDAIETKFPYFCKHFLAIKIIEFYLI
jgi:hypothetical protein